MKYIELFENYNNNKEETILMFIKNNALKFDRKDIIDHFISKGFDLDKHKEDLINYCIDNGLYDSIQLIDPIIHQEIVDSTTQLDLYGRNLSVIKINSLINLTILYCQYNNLTSLDLKNQTNLKDLNCSYNKLTMLDLTEQTKLEKLYCQINNLTSLDLTIQTNLKDLFCHNNNFPPELEALGNNISKWKEYYRNN